VAVLAACFVPALASADPPHAITDLDDARACLPLQAGGVAVATGGGLAVVSPDGRVHTLTALEGLPDTRAYAIAADGDALWIGTEAGAARVTLTPELAVRRTVALAGAPVHAVITTSTGVYFGTWGAGLLRLRAGDDTPEVVPAVGGGMRISALAQYGGSLYVAYADAALVRIDAGQFPATLDTPAAAQALSTITTADGQTGLLLGDIEGLFRVADGVTPIAPVDVRGLAQGPAGTLLVATYGSGLLAGPLHGALRREAGVPAFVNGVSSRGAVTCAATPEGVFVQAGGGGYERVALGVIPSNDVTVLADDGGGRVAVGTFDRGAVRIEGNSVSPVPGLEPAEVINAAAWQGAGASATLWLGSAHGLIRVPPSGPPRRFRASDGLPSSFVRSIFVQSDGRVLVGTDEGAAWVEGNRVVRLTPAPKAGPTPLASPAHATWALAESEDGTVWLGTNVGLYFGKGGSFRRLSLSTGDLRDDWVTALVVRGADVFVGTYAGGVTHLRAPHRGGFTLEHADLGGGCINPGGLTIDGDNLLAATMEGLLLRPAGDDRAAWAPRTQAAPGRDVTAVRRVGDMLWVGSRRGIGVTRP
jgi:hypothetical protein